MGNVPSGLVCGWGSRSNRGELVERIRARLAQGAHTNEAAVSIGILMPIIRKLGWDGSDPEQVVPEYPANAEVAKARLPHTIASLKPELVSLNQDSVHITTVAYFDGGWGYFVPRTERGLPKLVERYEKVGQGIYWWHPY